MIGHGRSGEPAGWDMIGSPMVDHYRLLRTFSGQNKTVATTRAMTLALLLLASAAVAAPAFAADWQTWERYMESGKRALEQGLEVGAENWFLDAVREAERLDASSGQLARSLKTLADLYRKQGRQREADALEQRMAALPPSSRTVTSDRDVVTALESYARSLREARRERDAVVVERRIQRLREVGVGSTRGDPLFFSPVAELRRYARLLRRQNQNAEAQRIELLAAAEAGKSIDRYANLRKGLSTESAAPSLTWMGQIRGAREALDGRLYPEAEGLLKDAVKTAETFASPDVRLAYTLSGLALAYRAQGKPDDFAAAVQRAMLILESSAGLNHSLRPRSLTLLALAHLESDFEPAKTRAHLERALRILEKDLVRDHPIIGLHFAGLAAADLALSRPEQAGPYLERALAIAARQYLPEHRSLAVGLMTVVDVYADQGDYARAHAIAQRVVAILGKMLDPDHPDVIMAVEKDRFLVQKLARPAEAVLLAAATTVPLEGAGNAMLVRATVNRSQRVLLVVDSGAAATLIRPLVLRRLGMSIPTDAPRRRLTVAGGQTLDVPFVTVAVQVGDATIEHLSVGVAEALPGAPDLDGLLGSDFLQRFRVILEKTARRMTLEPLPR